MDRRHFFRTLLMTPFIGSLMASIRLSKRQSQLYMITDSPQDFLWVILQELEKHHLIEERSFSFSGSSACEKAIHKSLLQKGWIYYPDPIKASFILSSRLLLHRINPSFTFIKDGNILDIRSRNLSSLWKGMQEDGHRSSLITIACFNTKRQSFPSGHWASVFVDGRQVDRLPLKKKTFKTYLTKQGSVAVEVEGGQAKVSESSCSQKICCLSAPASLCGERIICAPNHFLLEIERSSYVDTSIG